MHASLHRLCEECKSHNFSQTGWYGMAWQNERWWWWKIKEMLCVYLQDEFIGTIIIISPFRHHNIILRAITIVMVKLQVHMIVCVPMPAINVKKMFHFYLFFVKNELFCL